MKEVTWDGLDFAALQMLMVDHRWNGQPGVQMDKNRHVTVLTTDPAASSAMFATITAGYTVQIGDDGQVDILGHLGLSVLARRA